MLIELRNKKILTVFLWMVIVAFIGTIFLVWGMGGKYGSSKFAIKIDKTTISMDEYRTTYNNIENTFRQLFGDQYSKYIKNINIKEKVINDLIENQLFYQDAIDKKIPISEKEMLYEIAKIPSFNSSGKFDKNRYLQILSLNRISPSSFEYSVRKQLLINKLKYIIENSVSVTNKEIENEYTYRNTEANISFVSLTPDDFQNKVEITDEELNKFYEGDKNNYEAPKKIKVKYIEFDPANFTVKNKIENKEVENYYIKNNSKFIKPEKIKVSHILIKVNNWDDKNEVTEAGKKGVEILKQLQNNQSFAELAKKYSDDPSGKDGGKLGFVTRGKFVKEFEEVAFNLNEDELSDIVKTDYGFHIIKVDEKIPEKITPLKDVKKEIIKTITGQQKKSLFKSYVLNVYRDILKEGNITAYEKEKQDNITIDEIPFFTTDDLVSPIETNMEVMSSLFELERSEVSKITNINNKSYIFEVSDIQDEYIPDLANIKDDVKNDYITFKADEIAHQDAESTVKNYNDINDIASYFKTSVKKPASFKRTMPIPEIGSNSTISDSIFSSNDNTLIDNIFDANDKIYIIKVNKIILPDLSSLEKDSHLISSYLLNIKSREALREYLENLKNKTKITINPVLN